MKNSYWTGEAGLERQRLVTAYLNENLTYAKIAERMGTTFNAVEKATIRYNLRKTNKFPHINNKNNKIKISKEDMDKLVKELGEKLYIGYKKVKLTEPKVYKTKGTREEISILDISDTHLGSFNTVFDGETGKKIITYNEVIFEQELQILQDSIIEIHEILSHSYRLKKLIIFVTGDILTNDRIYEGQMWEIEKTVGLQLWDGVNYFSKFFNNLLKVYEEIEIVCVVGNHGRSQPLKDSDDEPVESNFEYHLYRIWQKQFENSKRIKIIVPNTRRYVHEINGWKHLIEHGDAIKGMSEQAIIKQIKELYINTKFDVFHMGHIHNIKEIEISDKIIAKINGAWIEKDQYAFRKFKTYSIPKQWFFGCSKSRPETWSYKLDLRKKK